MPSLHQGHPDGVQPWLQVGHRGTHKSALEWCQVALASCQPGLAWSWDLASAWCLGVASLSWELGSDLSTWDSCSRVPLLPHRALDISCLFSDCPCVTYISHLRGLAAPGTGSARPAVSTCCLLGPALCSKQRAGFLPSAAVCLCELMPKSSTHLRKVLEKPSQSAWSVLSPWQIPERNSLKEERFILAHGFQPQLSGNIAVRL
jgi:hypothetical protein